MLRRSCLCASLILTIACTSYGQREALHHSISSRRDSSLVNLPTSDCFHDYIPVWSLSELSETSEDHTVLILPIMGGPDGAETGTILFCLNQSGQLKIARFDSTEQHDFLAPYFQNKAWQSENNRESILSIRTIMLTPFISNYFLFIEGNIHHRWFTPEGMISRDTTHSSYKGYEWRPVFVHLAIVDWEQQTIELEGPFATDFHGRIRPVPIVKPSTD